jgi:putative membrane protein
MPESLSKPQQHARVPEEKRATEYLANERTFLAWIRTSIAVISAGFVISRFTVWIHETESLRAQASAPASGHKSVIVGVAMMALGAILALLAVWRYHIVNRCIEEGRVKADRGLVILVTAFVVLLATGMILFILLAPESR